MIQDEDAITVQEAMKRSDSDKWEEGMKSEMNSLDENKTSFQLIFGVALCSAATYNQPSARIVNGYDARTDSTPFMVSIMRFGYHSCGGSLINHRTVLTAAHCLINTSSSQLKVRSGHCSNSNVQSKRYSEAWELGTIYGWGIQHQNYLKSPIHLQYAKIPVIDTMLCQQMMLNRISGTMFCAGYIKGGVDACQNDSGGPFIINNKLYGIVSWGNGCAMPGRPGVYTNVSVVRPWIDEVLRKNYNEKVK
uniref:Peptidase S1 domain-containing protein n=1 Tax=Megaselia scalaris TaxID=36166 RepID=T1GKW1_MEGSC